MEEKSKCLPVQNESYQVDLSETYRQQVNQQIRILRSAIRKLNQLEELPLPPPKKRAP